MAKSVRIQKNLSGSATPTDLASQLEAIWNAHTLRDEDLSDPDRLAALLKEHLTSATGAVTSDAFDGRARCRRAR
jgi:hypothetical protein